MRPYKKKVVRLTECVIFSVAARRDIFGSVCSFVICLFSYTYFSENLYGCVHNCFSA